MKFLLVTLLLPLSALAQMTDKELHRVIDTLENPTKIANDLCDESVKKDHPWCKDFKKSLCEIKKSNTGKTFEDYDQELMDKYVTSLPATATPLEIARAKFKAMQAAEKETADRTGVTADDTKNLVGDVKASLIKNIRDSKFPKQREDHMVKTVSEIQITDAAGIVAHMKAFHKKHNPTMSAADVEIDAITYYENTCGAQGMANNAFYAPDWNVFVFCPGLIQSGSEYGLSKEDLLTGLSFTVGHEIGHSIDSQKIEGRVTVNQAAYAPMGACVKKENRAMDWNKQRGEVVGDYWGTKVIADRLINEKRMGEDVLNISALAMDGFCEDSAGDDEHPAGTFRIETLFGRQPQIRNQLECEGPTPEKPYCGLEGAQPPRPVTTKPKTK